MLRIPTAPPPAYGPRNNPLNAHVRFKTHKGDTLTSYSSLFHPRLPLNPEVSEQIHLPFTPMLPWGSCSFEFQAPAPHSNVSLENLFIFMNNAFKKWPQKLPIGVRRFLAGGVAGALAKTATAPLEAIKLQVVVGQRMSSFQALQALYLSGGVAAFFRGNSLDVLRTIPSKGIELATFDALKRLVLLRSHRTITPIQASPLPSTNTNAEEEIEKEKEGIIFSEAVLLAAAGAVAGILSTIAVHPIETLRTRIAIGGPMCPPGSNALTCLTGIIRGEGAGALFRGLDASIIGIMPYSAIRLGSYDALKRAYKRSTGRQHVSLEASLAFGAIAGVLSAVFTFPFEVARRRMMAGSVMYGNLPAALVGIVSQEGIGALYKGVELMILKQGPQYAISFAAYEAAKRVLAL